jgi:hypothetical protein
MRRCGFSCGAIADTARMRRLLLTACALFLALSFDAGAASRQSVDAMFSTLGMDKSWEASMGAAQDALLMLVDAPSEASLTPAQRHRVEQAKARLTRLMATELSWEALEPEVSQAYADVFSQSEIDAMTAFYGSPAARSMMARSPLLFSQLMAGGTDAAGGNTFTRDELDAFAAFRRSPAGQAVLAKSPLVSARLQQISQARMSRVQSQVTALVPEITHPADSEPGAAPPAH